MSEFNITELLKSESERMINKRFSIKVSTLNTGAFTPSILLVVRDLLENNFKMKYFKNENELNQFIQLLLEV